MSTDRRLTPEFKAKWLEALRGGHYKQGYRSLKDRGCFCCLGVALDVIDSGQWTFNGWGIDDERKSERFSMSDTTPLGKELGLSGDICNFLADLNDGTQSDPAEKRHWTFAEIADWIEANL